jgi:hypothetical protein
VVIAAAVPTTAVATVNHRRLVCLLIMELSPIRHSSSNPWLLSDIALLETARAVHVRPNRTEAEEGN